MNIVAVRGHGGDDLAIHTTAIADVLLGRAGRAGLWLELVAGNGASALNGDTGSDALYGRDGNDLLVGETGNFTGAGDDRVDGDNGPDPIDGGEGTDIPQSPSEDGVNDVDALGGDVTIDGDEAIETVQTEACTDFPWTA